MQIIWFANLNNISGLKQKNTRKTRHFRNIKKRKVIENYNL